MNASTIESIGKLGMGTLAICVLGWVLNSAITQNKELASALSKQVELTERQTTALERLVGIYSGKPNP